MVLIWTDLEHVRNVAYGADLSTELYQGTKPDIILISDDEYSGYHNAVPSRWAGRHVYMDSVRNHRKPDGRLEVYHGPLSSIGIQSV